jgi:hypothetical protein
MTRIKRGLAALKAARRHLVAAGAPSDLVAEIDRLLAKLESHGFTDK